MQAPKRNHVGFFGRDNDVVIDHIRNRGKQPRAVHGIRPRIGLGQFERLALANRAAFFTLGADEIVEDGYARDAKFCRRCLTLALIVNNAKLRQSRDLFVSVYLNRFRFRPLALGGITASGFASVTSPRG